MAGLAPSWPESLGMERMGKWPQGRRLAVCWLVAGKAKWKCWLKCRSGILGTSKARRFDQRRADGEGARPFRLGFSPSTSRAPAPG